MFFVRCPVKFIPVNLILFNTQIQVNNNKENLANLKNKSFKRVWFDKFREIIDYINSALITKKQNFLDLEKNFISFSLERICNIFVVHLQRFITERVCLGVYSCNNSWWDDSCTWEDLKRIIHKISILILRYLNQEKSDIFYLYVLVATQLQENVLSAKKISLIEEKRKFINVCLIQFYLSHCYLYDFVFSLKYWQENIFKYNCYYYRTSELRDEIVLQFELQNWCLKVQNKTLEETAKYFICSNNVYPKSFCPFIC